MANPAPTIAELQALIQTLQGQVAVLQNAAPAATAAPAAATTAVVFAETPQTLGVDDLIDFSMKRGKDIYNQGCEALGDKALTNGFNMTPNETRPSYPSRPSSAKPTQWAGPREPSRSPSSPIAMAST